MTESIQDAIKQVQKEQEATYAKAGVSSNPSTGSPVSEKLDKGGLNKFLPSVPEFGAAPLGRKTDPTDLSRFMPPPPPTAEQQKAQELERVDWQGLQADIATIGAQKDAGEVKDFKRFADRMVQLIEVAEDPEMVKDLKGLVGLAIHEYGDNLMPHFRANVGQQWVDDNIPEYEGPGFWGKLGGKGLGLVTPVLDWLDMSFQGVAAAGAAAQQAAQDDESVWSALGKGYKEAGKGVANMATFGQIDAFSPDQELVNRFAGEDGRFSFEEAIGNDINVGDFWGSGAIEGTLNLAGEIALDPTTYLGGAGIIKRLGKTIIGVAANQSDEAVKLAVPAIMRRIAEKGTGVLTREERALIQEMLMIHNLDIGLKKAKNLGPDIQGRVKNLPKWDKQNKLNESAREKLHKITKSRIDGLEDVGATGVKQVDRALNRLDRMGQSGVRWMGNTVPGTPTLSKLFKLDKGGAWKPATEIIEDLADVIHTTDDMYADVTKVRSVGDDGKPVVTIIDENTMALGTGPATPNALNAPPDMLALNAGPQPKPGSRAALANAEDMVAVIKQLDAYLSQLSPGQLKDVKKIVDDWDPLTEKLVLATDTQDAVFDIMDHVYRRGGGERVSDGKAFVGGSGGTPTYRPEDGIKGRTVRDSRFRGLDSSGNRKLPPIGPDSNRFGRVIDDAGETIPDRLPVRAGRFADDAADIGTDIERYTGLESFEDFKVVDPGTKEIANGLYTLIDADRTMLGKWMDKYPILKAFGDKFIPRFGLANRFGQYASDAVRTSQVRAHKGVLAKLGEIKSRLDGGLGDQAREAAKDLDVDLDQVLNSAMSDPDAYRQALDDYAGTAIADTLEMLEDVREYIYQGFSEDLQKVLPRYSYNPRVWTEDSKQKIIDAANADPDVKSKLSEAMGFDIKDLDSFTMNSASDDFLKKRTIEPELQDLFEVNKEAARVLERSGLKGMDELYETDLLAAWSARADSALRARIKKDFGDGLSKITGDKGQKLFVWADDTKGLQLGMTKHESSVFGRPAWVDSALDEDVANFFRVVDNPDEFGKFVVAAQEMWASMALLSPAFHVRNMYGNLFNMFLGGMRNPVKWIGKAADYASIERKIMKEVTDNGLSFTAAAKKLNIPEDKVTLLQNARDLNIMSGGQMDDILDNTAAPRAYRIDKRLAVRSRNAGTIMEGNARMAAFIQRVELGDSFNDAANHVKKFLFDYDDLTRFERKLRTKYARFYTFTRKNTALQMSILADNPGKVAALIDVQEELTDQLVGFVMGSDTGDSEGNWAPPWAQAALMGWRGGNLVGVDSPWTGAMETIEGIAALGTIPITIAGLDDEMPEGIKNALFYGDLSDQFNRAFSITSGFGPAMVQFAAGELTGTSTFTGQAHEDMRQNSLFRALSAINPFFARGVSFAEDLGWNGTSLLQNVDKIEEVRRDADRAITEAESKGRSTRGLKTGAEAVAEFTGKGERDNKRSMWLNWAMGLNVYPGEAANRQAEYVLKSALDDMYEDLGGYNIPTVAEMKKEGKLANTNAALQAIAYADPSNDAQLDTIQELLGKELFEVFIGEVPKKGTDIFADEEWNTTLARIQSKVTAWEYHFGRTIDSEAYAQIVQRSEMGLSGVELEEMGYEDPTRTSSVFIESEGSVAATLAENANNMKRLAEAGGFNVDDLYSTRLSNIQRALQDGAEVGMTWQEVTEWWVQNKWSRTVSGTVFGDDAINMFTDGSRSTRDEQREQTNAWQFSMELDAVFMLTQGRLPTLDEKEYYLFLTQMNVGDQKYNISMGNVPGWYTRRRSIPGAKNIQSKQQQADDAVSESMSHRLGIDGPFQGRYDRTPDAVTGPGIPGGYNRFEGPSPVMVPERFTRAFTD